MKKTLVKSLSLLLCLLLFLPLLAACAEKGNAFTRNGIRSVRLDKDGLCVTATMNEKTLKQYKGQTLRLYALMPGEELTTLFQKEPLLEKKVAATVTFELEEAANGANLLHAAFAAFFEDGSMLGTTLAYVENPEQSASCTLPFSLTGSSKGLWVDDVEGAYELGTSHALVPVHSMLLTEGEDVYLYNGVEYRYSEVYLQSIEQAVFSAHRHGMQVFAKWIAPSVLSDAEASAMMELLNERLAKTGALSAWLVSVNESMTPSATARLMRFAFLSLRSRTAHGRVLLSYEDGTAEQAKAFFTFFAKDVASAPFEWGVALSPATDQKPWEESPLESKLQFCELEEVLLHLKSSSVSPRPSYVAIADVSFSAEDPELQAASLAYAHRLCTSLGAFAVFYGEQIGDKRGLLDENRNARLAAEVFACVDTELTKEQAATVDRLSNGAFSELEHRATRHLLSGSAVVGSDGQSYDSLFAFSNGTPNGFEAIGSAESPTCLQSAALSRTVLFSWLSAKSGEDGGVVKQIADPSLLSGAFSISVGLLLQAEATSASTVTLRLDGVNKGGERISFSASARPENGTWQNVIFYVGSFTAKADLSHPVLMTLSVDAPLAQGTEYPLWIDSFSVRRPEAASGTSSAIKIVLLCTLGVFAVCIALYIGLSILKRRREKRQRRLH